MVESLIFHSAWNISSACARVLTNTMVMPVSAMRARIWAAASRPMWPAQDNSPIGSIIEIDGGAPSATAIVRDAPTKASIARGCATVAERPTQRRPGERVRRRDTHKANWSPRLVPARAWTSSNTMQASPPKKTGASGEDSNTARLSGVVNSSCGGMSFCRARRLAGVSPVRVSMRMGRFMSSTGRIRLRAISVARALSGET